MNEYIQNLNENLDPELIIKIGEYVDYYMNTNSNLTIRPDNVSQQFNISDDDSFEYLAYLCVTGKLEIEKRFKNDDWGGAWCNVKTPMGFPKDRIDLLPASYIRYIFLKKNEMPTN